MDLTDAQWAVLEPHFRPTRRADGRGRPWRETRAVLNAVLWVLRTGAAWHDLPNRYPPYQTCHRRLQQWRRNGTLTTLLTALAEDLRDRGPQPKMAVDCTPWGGAREVAMVCVCRSSHLIFATNAKLSPLLSTLRVRHLLFSLVMR